jgi:hypothetical protein
MSEHHHPHEGHDDGSAAERPLRHNWFFYVAGFFLLLAFIGFVLEGFPSLRPAPLPTQPPPSAESKR